MTTARRKLVDPNVTRIYHCITRCVRQAFLIDEGECNRKTWLVNRLRQVSAVYAVSVAAYGIMGNHMHFLLRLEPADASRWSAEEVIRRWAILHPPRKNRKLIEVTPEWVAEEAKNAKNVKKLRRRLANLGWFMKEVKEPLARMANAEDGTSGTFFEGRYKSIAVLDEAALLATCAYIDLNPFSAGLASTPESSQHTSLVARLRNLVECNCKDQLQAAFNGDPRARQAIAQSEDDYWLVPLSSNGQDARGDRRDALFATLSLAHYVFFVDLLAKSPRDGKVCLPPELEDIFQRMSAADGFWEQQRVNLTGMRPNGNFFASSQENLQLAATRLGKHHCVNLNHSGPQRAPATNNQPVSA